MVTNVLELQLLDGLIYMVSSLMAVMLGYMVVLSFLVEED